jgi:hypothetical protein
MKRNEDSSPNSRRRQKIFFSFSAFLVCAGKKKLTKKLSLSLSMNRLLLRSQNEKKKSFSHLLSAEKAEKAEIRVTLIGCSSLLSQFFFRLVSEICNLATFLQTHTHSHT